MKRPDHEKPGSIATHRAKSTGCQPARRRIAQSSPTLYGLTEDVLELADTNRSSAAGDAHAPLVLDLILRQR
ncbi:MAG: hypothetical protein KTR25_15760 [Myxococcales bacterium]|nr:hypothetical protein [Myxococcales bacterium]